jgi:hypothetical protein
MAEEQQIPLNSLDILLKNDNERRFAAKQQKDQEGPRSEFQMVKLKKTKAAKIEGKLSILIVYYAFLLTSELSVSKSGISLLIEQLIFLNGLPLYKLTSKMSKMRFQTILYGPLHLVIVNQTLLSLLWLDLQLWPLEL